MFGHHLEQVSRVVTLWVPEQVRGKDDTEVVCIHLVDGALLGHSDGREGGREGG